MSDDVVDDTRAGRFELHRDGEVAGYAEYRRAEGTISFTHTEVEDRFEGHGVGSALVRGALDAARDGGEAVLPFCPFVRSYVQRHPEYVALVPPERRAEFEFEGP